MTIRNDQLEFVLQSSRNRQPSTTVHRKRLTRAALWFNRMRQVVDDAVDYPPAPAPRAFINFEPWTVG